MREIMVLSMADFRIMDATAEDLSKSATWSEQKCAGERGKKSLGPRFAQLNLTELCGILLHY